MHPTILVFLDVSVTAKSMCAAAIALFFIGLLAAKNDIAAARGMDKVAALANFCFALPLAVFGALHLAGPQFVKNLVPAYIPGRMFWVYFVGCALIAASLSISTRIAVRWSGLLFGIMMFMFVAMLYIPGALRNPHNRIIWTIVFRESSFGAAAWILAATAKDGWRGHTKNTLIMAGRILVAAAAIFFGVEHFLHPLGLPGVPLQREMPAWVPGRVLIDYLTGAALVATGLCFLLARKARVAANYLGAWLLLLILVIYVPVMITALSDPKVGAQVEGINYFADTLLFTGVILSAASITPRSD